MYRTVAQIDSAIQLLSTLFPQFFSRHQLQEPSVEGRPIHALQIHAGGATGRSAVLVVGGTHARELMNPDAILDLAIDLLLSYSNGTHVKYGNRTWLADEVSLILESLDIWFLPCSNPDGREYVTSGADDLWRKNRRINAGSTCVGVDVNRNADIVWGVTGLQTSCSPCSIVYCGPAAFSEPETRNVRSLLDSGPFVTFLDVHSFSELVLYPWGHAGTQSTDPSKVFTGLATGTCTASVPGNYAEYMPTADVQKFTTVSHQVVADIAAVRGRRYTAESIHSLYPATGSLSDYAYSRHIKDPAQYKTYGFSYETGPNTGDDRQSFHPDDPSLIQLDIKAGILSLLQQSVCAIELIGLNLFADDSPLRRMRFIRDTLLAKTAAGREWIALYERSQFPLLTLLMRKPKLAAQAAELLKSSADWLAKDEARIPDAAIDQALRSVNALRSMTKKTGLRRDLTAVATQLMHIKGHTVRTAIDSLLRKRRGPSTGTTKSRSVSRGAEPARAGRPHRPK